MTPIRYGFFGEDDAQRLFLRHYLATVTAGSQHRFEFDEALVQSEFDLFHGDLVSIGRGEILFRHQAA